MLSPLPMLPAITLLSFCSHPGSPTPKKLCKSPSSLGCRSWSCPCVIPIVPLLHLNYDSFPPSQAFLLLALLPVPPVATSGSQSALHSSGQSPEAGVKSEVHTYPPSSLVTSSNASSFLEIKNSHKASPCCSWPSGTAYTQDT